MVVVCDLKRLVRKRLAKNSLLYISLVFIVNILKYVLKMMIV
jgi:hypothetical protein